MAAATAAQPGSPAAMPVQTAALKNALAPVSGLRALANNCIMVRTGPQFRCQRGSRHGRLLSCVMSVPQHIHLPVQPVEHVLANRPYGDFAITTAVRHVLLTPASDSAKYSAFPHLASQFLGDPRWSPCRHDLVSHHVRLWRNWDIEPAQRPPAETLYRPPRAGM